MCDGSKLLRLVLKSPVGLMMLHIFMAAESDQKLAFMKSFITSLYLSLQYYAEVATI